MNEKLLFVYRETARSIERAFSRSDLAREFAIELKGKMSIYDALVKSGAAENFHHAVRLVAEKFPPSRAGFTSSWSEIALWTWDYDHGRPAAAPAGALPEQPHACADEPLRDRQAMAKPC